ncbi:MAG: hypothetical protein GY846_17685 [Deltaproteobacteria bacterium]|nr:hypothetical protein [Deltaproteobacteria bacterium]
MTNNRFNRHPLLSFLLIAFFLVLIAEVFLRLIDPDILKFAYNFRQTYQYHEKWYTDFQPNASARIALKDSSGSYFFNFILTINEFGFRSHDRKLDSHLIPGNDEKIIHTIGDSFTMGWGVNYQESYPAILDFNLPEKFRVLNLGLNGFGTIAATEKSRMISRQFMPDIVVYLATENDYEDDEKAMAHSKKPWIIHKTYDVLNFLRHNTYLASVPFALYWWTYYRKSIEIGDADFPESKQIHNFVNENLSISKEKYSSDPSMGIYSKSVLLEYNGFLKKKKIPFIILCHGAGKVSKDIFAFCRENGIDSYLIKIPKNFRLNKEGHFNFVGNFRLAHLIRSLLFEKKLVVLKQGLEKN